MLIAASLFRAADYAYADAAADATAFSAAAASAAAAMMLPCCLRPATAEASFRYAYLLMSATQGFAACSIARYATGVAALSTGRPLPAYAAPHARIEMSG